MAQREVPSPRTCDVFLNFRSTNSFVENLDHSLREKGIHTVRGIHAFFDDGGLERGEEIALALLGAIRESMVAIVVFSTNYASSIYCLEELFQIMECLKGEGRLVLPVFYDVDSSVVRDQTNNYGKEFAKLEEKFQHDKEKVQKWRKALYEAANLSGFDYMNWSPLKLVEEIVEMVNKEIDHIPLPVGDHPVVEVTSMAKPASPSPSFTCTWTYDVFLNFRGTDTRTSFVEFLYHSLRQKGIHTFIDDEGLERGEEITPALLRAIQESRIAIVVFSKNYASSTYCLKELVQIMECLKGEGRLVLPVFYEVDPSEVRHQRNSYGVEFAKLEEKFQDNKENVQKWRKTLHEAANLSGFHFKDGSPLKLIEMIVEEVSKKINRIPLHVADHPVGLESQLQKVISLLKLGYEKGVNMVGIYGIGGIGKTTIARALYNSIADQFESACFLADIREKSTKDDGLVKLQKTLLSELLDENNVKFSDINKGISILKRRLCNKKILLILDDVDELEQLKAIAGGRDWFGFGSRVIITTRDKRWLATHGVVQLYEIKILDSRKALELFSWHAFKKEEVDPNFADLSNRALRYTSGLPLALEVIGSYLFDKSRDEWKSALDKFERSPNQKLYKILKVSYNSLDEDVKGIFLDIACFFNGNGITYVTKMLRVREFHPEDGIRVLMDKSLVKVDDSNVVRMHDLIRDMGKEIVRQESIDEPGKRSRLWFAEDIIHVLQENTGSDKIEVIVLYLGENKEVRWSGIAFKEMKRLRVLIIANARFSTSPKHLPNSLRVLDWSGYLPSSLPSDFHPKKLVILNLPASCLENFEPLKTFESLSIVDFKDCKFTEVPDLSGVLNLEYLCLDNCTKLTRIHDSIGFLDKLVYLSAKGCTQLLTLVPRIKLTSLETLDLRECSHLQSFPEVVGRMDDIRDVYLDHTAISELPPSVGNLIGLERLFLRECKMLNQLPYSIKTLPKLEVIMAFGCRGLRLYEHGNPEYVGSEVSSSMMLLDISEYAVRRFVDRLVPCFLKAHTVIMSDNFIQVCMPLQLPDQVSGFVHSLELLRFDHLSIGSSLSFWFRNKFPKITLAVNGRCSVHMNKFVLEFKLCLLINGAKQLITSCNRMFSESKKPWLVLMCDVVCEAEKLFIEHEWNHVEVSCELKYHWACDQSPIVVDDKKKLAIAVNELGIGVHVCKENSSMEDVQFTLPNSGIEARKREEMTALEALCYQFSLIKP